MFKRIALLFVVSTVLAQLPPGEIAPNASCPRLASECLDFVEICLGNVVQQYDLTTNPACTQAFQCLIQGGELFELICCNEPNLYFCKKTKGADYAALIQG